jgi:hypothetical protein
MKTKGFSLVAVLVLGAVAVLVITALINFANTNLSAGRRAVASEQAFRSAEAGIEYYHWLISRGGSLSSPATYDFRNASGTVVGTYELSADEELTSVAVTSIGRSGGATRTVKAEFVQGEGTTFYYGVQSGNGGFNLENNARVVGNVYSNFNINGKNGSSITGDALAVGSISGVSVGGQRTTGVSPQPMPISEEEIQGWKDDADANVSTGNLTITGEGNILGPRKIVGDLTIRGSAELIITDTIWVTGNITLENGAYIALSSSYGERGGVIIADGVIDIDNNVTLEGSGEPDSFIILLSTSSSDLAIDVGNNNSSVILYAPNGTISLGNNADVQVITAKAVSLGNNVVLEYEQGIINTAFQSGPSGGWELRSWKEIQ